MKLKKIASLMLAGVMAVSMLAGCSNGTKPENPTEEPVDTSIASYLNDAQKDNDVKAAFTYDNDLEAMMQKALVVYGADASDGNVKSQIQNSMNVATNNVAASIANLYGTSATATKNSYVYIYVKKDTSSSTDEALMKQIAKDVDFSQLKDEGSKDGYKYTYTNTGKVAMVKSETANGVINRYVAVVVSCTTTSAAE